MKLNIKKGEAALRLPKKCVPLLADADLSDLKVLIYISSLEENEEDFDAKKAAEVLSLSESEIKSSLKFWNGASVLKKASAKVKKDEKAEEKAENSAESKTVSRTRRALPEKKDIYFTSGELCEIAEANAEFKKLLDAAQQTAGWIFNEHEIGIIAALYVSLRLSSEYILALIGYYVTLREKPLRYLEKVAYSLIDEGIDTPEALEEKLRYLEKYEGYEGMVRRLFGLGSRSLIEKERVMLSSWMNEYGYGEDIVKKAYEITVNNTGKASLSYANTILKNWFEAGVKKVSDIKKTTAEAPKKTTRQGTATARSFNVDDALNKALERSYKGDKK